MEQQPYDPTLIYPAPASSLAGTWLTLVRAAWILLALAALTVLILSLPGYAQTINSGLPGHGPATDSNAWYVFLQAINTIASLVSGILSLSLSVILFRSKFENPAVAAVSFYLLIYSVVMAGPLEALGMYWFGNVNFVITIQTLLMATPTLALLVLFPNGEFIPAWGRWVLIASVPWSLIAIIYPIFPYQENNLIGLLVMALLWITLLGLGLYAQVYRYRRISTSDERQQTKWVLFGFSIWIGYILISTFPYFYLTSLPTGAPQPWWSPLSELGWWLSLNIVPVTLAIAITRSRLWNINVVINRTLVYGALTVATMALYVLVVGALGNLLQVGNSTFIAFLTTGFVAILFQPLRDRLQNWVNRLMYGERDDPVAVLNKLGTELERTGSPEDALASITKTVAMTLKLPYVAIELGENSEIAATYGIPKAEAVRFPMQYQTETSGYLVVAPRSPRESFSTAERQLLEHIAQQAGAAAHAAKLTADLRMSRQRLVTAREEERRRLRRDLHDGLGPTLASLTLKMDVVRNVLRSDPEQAEQLLAELKQQTQATIQDIRTLVYELRPPTLDELGLIGAIQNFIDGQTAIRPKIILETSDQLPPLPAAFEVAVYRIALEGLTNILRHANANNATIKIVVQRDQLVVEILDDGVGLTSDFSPGVGLASMQERAEELGGAIEIVPRKPGTRIRARLPLHKE